MGEKANLDPATVADAAAGGSVVSNVVDVAAAGGQKLGDAVLSESAGAVVGGATARMKRDKDDPNDGADSDDDASR